MKNTAEKNIDTSEDLTSQRVLIFSSAEGDDTKLGQELEKLNVSYDTENNLSQAISKLLKGDFQILFSDITGFNRMGFTMIDWVRQHLDNMAMFGLLRPDAPGVDSPFFKLASNGLFTFSGNETNPITKVLCEFFAKNIPSRWIEKASAEFHRQRDFLNNIKDDKIQPVLVVEAAGSASESLAQIAHDKGSRKDYPFIIVDCSPAHGSQHAVRIPKDQISLMTEEIRKNFESLLGEAVNGTVFFRYVDELPILHQDIFASVIENGYCKELTTGDKVKFKGQIVFATTELPDTLVTKKKLSSKLRKVIGSNIMHIPSIMEYREDIPAMADVFVKVIARDIKKNQNLTLTKAARDIIASAVWKESITELYQFISRAIVETKGTKIKPEAFVTITKFRKDDKALAKQKELNKKKRLLQKHLKEQRGDVTRVGKIYGKSRQTIYSWMSDLDIPRGYGKPNYNN